MKKNVGVIDKAPSIKAARMATKSGLDFIVRNQCCDEEDANCGRIPYAYNISKQETLCWSPNWIAGISVQALLVGYRFLGNQEYYDSARRLVDYIRSLQEYSPVYPERYGVIREKTPQTDWLHPRDAITAAWAMLDWYLQTEDIEALKRSELYAKWFMDVAMERGYPYWTVRLDGCQAEPDWFGSFHSGSAYFFYRLFVLTEKECYRETMKQILDFYNKYHLDSNGNISVVCHSKTMESLDSHADPVYANPVWKKMHVYNDDFGTLANLAAFSLSDDESCLDAAERFLKCMYSSQQDDGGFGDQEGTVPSAAGTILIELFAAKELGLEWVDNDVVQNAVQYLLNLQYRCEGSLADGAFCETSGCMESNMRTHAYALNALMLYAGADESFFCH